MRDSENELRVLCLAIVRAKVNWDFDETSRRQLVAYACSYYPDLWRIVNGEDC